MVSVSHLLRDARWRRCGFADKRPERPRFRPLGKRARLPLEATESGLPTRLPLRRSPSRQPRKLPATFSTALSKSPLTRRVALRVALETGHRRHASGTFTMTACPMPSDATSKCPPSIRNKNASPCRKHASVGIPPVSTGWQLCRKSQVAGRSNDRLPSSRCDTRRASEQNQNSFTEARLNRTRLQQHVATGL